MADKRRPGRRSKLTPEVQEKIVSAIRAGNYAAVAAAFAGVGESTFYAWLAKGREAKSGVYRELLEAVKRAESEAEVRAVAIVQSHMEDNWVAGMTFLERKFPQRWGRRDRLSVEIEPRTALASLLGVSPEDLDEAVEAAAEDGS